MEGRVVGSCFGATLLGFKEPFSTPPPPPPNKLWDLGKGPQLIWPWDNINIYLLDYFEDYINKET